MSERKVLNKYYPPDYDPSHIPRAKRPKTRQWTIRTMAPFNMRCNTCGEYIYKGKKFNSRQELADGETYLGLKIFRFYIKCPRCVSEISFKTDPENVDYAMEGGATRNFEALRTAELMAEREAKEKEEELENNPMKMLENRTKASQREMDMLETLEDLRDQNSKHNKVDMEDILLKYKLYEEKLQQLQDEEDEKFVQSVFGKSGEMVVKRLNDDSDGDLDDTKPAPSKIARLDKPTDFLTHESTSKDGQTSSSSTGKTSNKKSASTVKKSVGLLSSSKSALGMLVKKKQPNKSSSNTTDSKNNENDNKPASGSCDKNPGSAINSSKDNEQVKSSIEKADVQRPPKSTNSTTVVTAACSSGATVGASGGLSLLGNYSGTDSDEESN